MPETRETFKVWAEIELHEDGEPVETVDAPGADVAEFDTYGEAQALVCAMNETPRIVALLRSIRANGFDKTAAEELESVLSVIDNNAAEYKGEADASQG